MGSPRIPSGGLILPSIPAQTREAQQTQQPQPVIPQWSRPDDAERQARLDAMKRRATALLAGGLLVFVGANIFEPQVAWLRHRPGPPGGAPGGGAAPPGVPRPPRPHPPPPPP